MKDIDFRTEYEAVAERTNLDYSVLGFLTDKALVYPLGTDTKVLSTIFESISRPLVYRIAARHGVDVWEPVVQNSYPDFTLLTDEDDRAKIAVDVKTTYVDRVGATFSFTLGGYTSFLRNDTKNIEFPYSEYSRHWIIGYVYHRILPSNRRHVYGIGQVTEIQPPYTDVQVFVQEKWRIAGDKAGSGNTTNIGSIRGCIDDFRAGRGVFSSREEYLDYWRNYERTAAERRGKFKNIAEYRRWRGRRD